jgi:O-antigen/teichoic acid export membrane protein
MVGQFALGLAVTAPIIMFTNMDLRGVQVTDARQEYHFADYFSLRLFTVLSGLIVITALAFSLGYARETALVILALGGAKAFEALSDIFYGLLQRHERMDRIAISKMIKGIISLMALSAGVALTGSVFWGAVSMAFVWGVLLISYDLPNGRRVLQNSCLDSDARQMRPHLHLPTLLRLLRLALPLGLVMLMISLNTNIPRYFLEAHWGAAELGIFAALAYVLIGGGMLIEALGQAASARLANYYAAGNRRAFVHLLLKLVGMGLILGCGGVLVALVAGKPILTLIYGSAYARQDVFVWLMCAAALYYVASFLGFGMTAARYFRVQPLLFALVTGSTVLACVWLVPPYGLIGAALALIIAACIQVLGSLSIVSYAVYQLTTTTGNSNNDTHIA